MLYNKSFLLKCLEMIGMSNLLKNDVDKLSYNLCDRQRTGPFNMNFNKYQQ